MWQKVFLFIGFCCLMYCNCDNNVDTMFEPEGSTPRFNEIIHFFNINSSRCVLDIIDIIDAALNLEMWAIKMIDASGKIQSGFLEGNIINLGSYSECLSVKGKSSSNSEIFGKYCLSFVFFTSIPKPMNLTYGVSEDIKRIFNENPGLPILQGICLPDSCTAKEMSSLIDSILDPDLIPIKVIFDEGLCVPDEKPHEFTNLQWIAATLFIAIFIFMILSTLYELYLMKMKSKPYHPILISFSTYTNLKNLYKVRKDPDQLACINGIRTISMMWVILGHKYLVYSGFPHVNYIYILKWLKQTSTAFVLGAMFSVDTFFFISGLLIVYVVLLAKAKQFNFSLIQYYLHRNFRLSPAFFMTILFYLTFLKYCSSGPVWSIASKTLVEPCEKNWWYSMLYIQNVLDLDVNCITQGWYLAADTQLYVLAPLLFIPLQRWPKPTIIFIVLLAICSSALVFTSAWITEANGRVTEVPSEFHILQDLIFFRCNAWLVGSLLGYYLFIKRGKIVVIDKILVLAFWTLSIFIILSIVLMHEYFYQYEYNKWVTSIFYAISKILWSISLSWIIFACVHGYGGIVNKFLSMKIFMILGRLTYSMYLVHVAYLTASVYGGETNTNFSNSSILYEYGSDFIMVIIISHVWTLAFESPLISIGKLIMPREMSKKLTAIHEENENMSETNTTL